MNSRLALIDRPIAAVGVLTLVLLGLVEPSARNQAAAVALDSGQPAMAGAQVPPPSALGASSREIECPPDVHDQDYFRVILTIAIVYFLVTPALCLFAYRAPREPLEAWIAFWTFSFLVFLAHVSPG